MTAKRLTWVCFWLVLILAGPARGGPAEVGGQLAAEPRGLAGIAIVKETLTLDLSGLASARPAEVEAVYEYEHAGDAPEPLWFVSGTGPNSGFTATIDDQPAKVVPAPDGAINPDDWPTPATTPPLPGRDSAPIPYSVSRRPATGSDALGVLLPTGRHALRVHYRVELERNLRGEPTVYWQMAYPLAPAKTWKGHGGLDVSVTFPEGWNFALAPAALTSDGHQAHGRFDAIPADAIALTAQYASGPAHDRVRHVGLVLLGLVFLAGPVVFIRTGRSLALQNRPAIWAATIFGLAWALSLALSGVCAVIAPDWTLPATQVQHFGYRQNLAMVAIVGSALHLAFLGFCLCLVSAYLTRKRQGSANALSTRVSG